MVKFITTGDYRRLEAERDSLAGQLQDANATIGDLREQIDFAEGVEALAHQELERMGGIIDETIESIAVAAVVSQERVRLEEEGAEELQRTHREDFAARFRAEEGPGIIAGLRTLFEQDGTFRRVEAEERETVTAEIQRDVINDYRGTVRQQLGQPEETERLKARFAAELAGTEQGAAIRSEVELELHGVWRSEVLAQAEAEITAEVEGGEEAFKERARQELANSWEMQRYREQVTQDKSTKWHKATRQEVVAAIEDEAEREALAARVQLIEQEANDAEEKANKLEMAKTFTTTGIELSQMPERTIVAIKLGRIEKFKDTQRQQNSWGDWRNVEVDSQKVICQRQLQLVANGDETFTVIDDSFKVSDRPHEQQVAIPTGTIVTVGRRLSRNGVDELDSRVSADCRFAFDDNTTDETFVDSLMSVADIMIDGVSARGVEHTEYA